MRALCLNCHKVYLPDKKENRFKDCPNCKKHECEIITNEVGEAIESLQSQVKELQAENKEVSEFSGFSAYEEMGRLLDEKTEQVKELIEGIEQMNNRLYRFGVLHHNDDLHGKSILSEAYEVGEKIAKIGGDNG